MLTLMSVWFHPVWKILYIMRRNPWRVATLGIKASHKSSQLTNITESKKFQNILDFKSNVLVKIPVNLKTYDKTKCRIVLR